MKKAYTLLLALPMLFVSCGSDDSSDAPADNDVSVTDFLPLTTGSYWVYDTNSSTQSGRDSLYIANDTIIGGNTYDKFKTLALPTGFYTGSLAENGVRKSGDKLLLSGSAQLAFSEEFPLSIGVTDFVIFKENTINGQALGSTTGTIEQPYDGYVVKFDYTLSAKAKQDLATYTVPGHPVYTNVKQVETSLNLKITAVFNFEGLQIPVNIMNDQKVLVSTQFYAENIGVVHVVSDVNYTLADMSALPIQLPIPQTGSEHQEEVLVHYNVE